MRGGGGVSVSFQVFAEKKTALLDFLMCVSLTLPILTCGWWLSFAGRLPDRPVSGRLADV